MAKFLQDAWREYLREVWKYCPDNHRGTVEHGREIWFAACGRLMSLVMGKLDGGSEATAKDEEFMRSLYEEMAQEDAKHVMESRACMTEVKLLENMDEQQIAGVIRSMAIAVEDAGTCWGLDKPLFALVVFNDPKVGQYVSNCERACMIEALKEAVARLEGKEDVPR